MSGTAFKKALSALEDAVREILTAHESDLEEAQEVAYERGREVGYDAGWDAGYKDAYDEMEATK